MRDDTLLDIEPVALSADGLDALDRLATQPEARWYFRRRREALAAAGLLGAYNPMQPRGKDGKWIEVYGWVRWLQDGKWRRGQVSGWSKTNGDMLVKDDEGTNRVFQKHEIPQRVYTVPGPKATLNLPKPASGDSAPGFSQVGPQAGSNPGAMYQVSDPTLVQGKTPLTADMVRSALAFNGGLDKTLTTFPLDADTWDPLYGQTLSPNALILDEADNKVFTRVGGSFWDLETNDMVSPEDVFGSPNSARRKKLIGKVSVFQDPEGGHETLVTILDSAKSMAGKKPGKDSKLYIKTSKSVDHARNEQLANYLYELGGVPVPETSLGDDGITFSSRIVEGEEIAELSQTLNDQAVLDQLKENFVFDAWLANWDVVGATHDNVKVVDGVPFRIDAGGALTYRAMGKPKGAAFGNEVGELDSLITQNQQAGQVYKGITPAQLKDGAERLAAITPQDILNAVEVHGLDPSLANKLIARRSYILNKYDVPEPPVQVKSVQALAPELPPVDVLPDLPPSVQPGDDVPKTFPSDISGMYYNAEAGNFIPGTAPSSHAVEYHQEFLEAETSPQSVAMLVGAYQAGKDIYVNMNNGLWKVDGIESPTPFSRNLDLVHTVTGETWKTYDLESHDEIPARVFGPDLGVDMEQQYGYAYRDYRDHITNKYTDPDQVLNDSVMGAQGISMMSVGLDNWDKIQPGTWIYSAVDGVPYKVSGVPVVGDISYLDGYNLDGELVTDVPVNWSMQKGTPGSLLNETFDAMQARNIVAKTQDINDSDAPTSIAQSNIPTPTDTTMQELSASSVPAPADYDYATDLSTKATAPDVETPEPTPEPEEEPVDYFDPETGINKNLTVVGDVHTSKSLDLGTAETLIGKKVYFQSGNAWTPPGVYTVESVKYAYGNNDPSYGLEFTVVDATGQKIVKRTYPQSPSSDEMYEIEGNIAPIMQYSEKKDGTIVVNGEVVGSWGKEMYTYSNGYSYATGSWEVTISGKYTVSGQDYTTRSKNKKGIKPAIVTMLLPPGSGGSKPKTVKVKEIQKQVVLQQIAFGANIKEKTAEGNAVTMMDGAEVKLGMWTISKTDGKIGKIVATKVSPEAGVAGSVKVEYTDPVTGKPFVKIRGASTLSAAIDQDTGAVPPGSPLFSKVKLSDGSQPFASQEVMSSAGASVIIMGIKPDGNVRVIDTKTGAKEWVKASSLTKSKDYAKEVIVEVDAEPAGYMALAEETWKTAPKAKKIPYAATGGAVISQEGDAIAKYREFAPARKLTKDNFVPRIGMKVRDSKGNQLVIVRQNKTFDSNPSTVYVVDPTVGGKPVARQPSALWVDHAAELSTWDGKPVPKVSKISSIYAGDQPFPSGSTVYSYSEVSYSYGGTRTKTIKYLVLQPDGQAKHVGAEQAPTTVMGWKLQEIFGKGIGKVAYIDSTSTSTLTMEPHGQTASKLWIHDSTPGALEDLKLQAALDNTGLAITPPTPTPTPTAPTAPIDPTPATPNVPEAPPEPTSGQVTMPGENAIEPEPFHGDSGTLVDLPKPSSAPETGQDKNKVKPPPQPQSTPERLKGPAVVAGSYSIETGIEQLKAQMESGDAGSRVLYSMGDSDYIEDMAIRLQSVVDQKTNTEMIEIRFQLLEDKVDDLGSRLIANGGQVKLGGWDKTPLKGPKDIVPGDAISVRISSAGTLKPADITSPNATVVGQPVLLGKSPNGFDAYSINVVTAGGAPGTIIVEQRPTPSVPTYEWNPDKVIQSSYFNASVNPDATSLGWSVRNDGGIGYETVSGIGVPDSKGRKIINSADTSFRSTGAHEGTMRMKYDGGEGAFMTVQVTHPESEARQANLFHGGSGHTGSKPEASKAIRHSVNGEVLIRVAANDPNALDRISEMMAAAGVPPSAQGQPSGRDIRKMALNKVYKQFNTTYTHMERPDVTGEDDASAQAVLSLLEKHVAGAMPGDRKVTMDDIHTRVHDGRMEIVLSDDVARALTKNSSITYAYHKLNNGYDPLIWTSKTHTGLMSTDERWSAGIVVSGGSSVPDVTHDAGNRLYFRFSSDTGKVSSNPEIILSPLAVNKKLDNYWAPGDYWGRREPPDTAKQYLNKGGFNSSNQLMIKRTIDPEMMAYVQVSYSEREKRLKELHAAGVTHINGRPVEEIFVESGSIPVGDVGELGAHYGTEVPITAIPIEGPAVPGAPAAVMIP